MPNSGTGRTRGGLLVMAVLLAPAFALAQIPSADQPLANNLSAAEERAILTSFTDGKLSGYVEGPSNLSAKQKRVIVQANFAKSRTDATQLATLARELREEVSKPTTHTLSAEALSRVEKIEKLAKRIREQTKGF